MITNFSPKLANNFTCMNCNYICSKYSDFNKHVLTLKHKMITLSRQNSPKNTVVNVEKNINTDKAYMLIKAIVVAIDKSCF